MYTLDFKDWFDQKAFVWTPVSLKAIWGNDFVSKAQARSIISNSGGYLKLWVWVCSCVSKMSCWALHSFTQATMEGNAWAISCFPRVASQLEEFQLFSPNRFVSEFLFLPQGLDFLSGPNGDLSRQERAQLADEKVKGAGPLPNEITESRPPPGSRPHKATVSMNAFAKNSVNDHESGSCQAVLLRFLLLNDWLERHDGISGRLLISNALFLPWHLSSYADTFLLIVTKHHLDLFIWTYTHARTGGGGVQIYKLYISKRENDETHRRRTVLQNIKRRHNPNNITVFQKSVVPLAVYDGCIVNAL